MDVDAAAADWMSMIRCHAHTQIQQRCLMLIEDPVICANHIGMLHITCIPYTQRAVYISRVNWRVYFVSEISVSNSEAISSVKRLQNAVVISRIILRSRCSIVLYEVVSKWKCRLMYYAFQDCRISYYSYIYYRIINWLVAFWMLVKEAPNIRWGLILPMSPIYIYCCIQVRITYTYG